MGFVSRTSLRADIKWGLGWGLWLAGAFALLGSALFLLQGTVLGHPSVFSFPMVILGYITMGVVGGVLLGVFRPLTQRRLGATILGMIIGTVVYFIAGLVAVGAKEFLSLGGFVVSLILGTVGGGYFGYSTWGERRANRH